MKACIRLRIKLVDDERRNDNDDIFGYLVQPKNQPNGDVLKFKVTRPEDRNVAAAIIENLHRALEVLQRECLHHQLRNDIIENLWNNKGNGGQAI